MSTDVTLYDEELLDSEQSYVEAEDGRPWWKAISPDDVQDKEKNKKFAAQLSARVRFLMTKMYGTYEMVKRYEDFYNMDMDALVYSDSKYYKHTSCNLLRIGVNSIHSMIGKEMPTINFMTNRAKYPLRRQVSLLNDYIQAEFEHSELYRNVRAIVRDAACSNLGTVKVYLDEATNSFKAERISPRDLVFSDADENFYRKPELFERKLVSKYALMEMLPDLEEWQKKIIKDKADTVGSLLCYEGFYKNNLHVIFIDGCILFAERWHDHPPYFHWRWTEKTNSFWGKGICEEGWNVQNKLNNIYYKYALSVDMFSVNKVIMTGSGRFTSQNISDNMEILKFHGSDVSPKNIQFVTPPIMHPQHFQLAETYKQDFFLSSSLSQLTASGQKEKGVYTASGAMAVHDIQQSRFAQASQSLVDMYVDIARFMVREASRAFYGETGGTSLAGKIEWRKLDLEENYHHINEAPVARISKDPQQRMQQLTQMQMAGWITPQRAMEKFDSKDFKEDMDIFTSSIRAVEMDLNAILDGERIDPSPHIPMALQYRTAVTFYNKERADGLDEDTEEAMELRRYMDTCNKKIQKEQAAMQQQQMQAFVQGQGAKAPPAPPRG